jgi:2-oxoglutarate ferredoxin oxidoreductase subunit delta
VDGVRKDVTTGHQGVVAVPRIVVDESRCKACTLCILFCPREILGPAPHTNEFGYHPVEMTDESKCTGCRICALMCPDVAITVCK